MLQDSVKSHILISNDLEGEIQRLQDELKPNRVIAYHEDKFLIEHSKKVVAEAYISEFKTKYLIIATKEFSVISQNSLLKVFEEPPRNIEFIIITPSKSTILPTVLSRLPILRGEKIMRTNECELNLAQLDYSAIFAFLKTNARIKRVEAKELIEALYYRATVTDALILSSSQLENFDKAYRLLELNSRPQTVLALILMGFVDAR